VCFGEALATGFAGWSQTVLENARALARGLQQRGYRVVTGGTDTPLVLVDLRATGLTGARAQSSLEAAGLPCNKNVIPGDGRPFETTSGVRFGVSAVTTRGLTQAHMTVVAEWIADLLDALAADGDNTLLEKRTRQRVAELAAGFPIYPTDSSS
jgi:glycine hydroxymethyltransferase